MATGAQTGVIDTSVHNQRIGTVEVASGKIGFVSPANLHVYGFDWSPDGARLVATAAPGPGGNNWCVAQLYIFDAATGTGRSIYKPTLQIAVPRWSPDGKSIAFLEGLMSDEVFTAATCPRFRLRGARRRIAHRGARHRPIRSSGGHPNSFCSANMCPAERTFPL